jgi:hypothetical protein
MMHGIAEAAAAGLALLRSQSRSAQPAPDESGLQVSGPYWQPPARLRPHIGWTEQP